MIGRRDWSSLPLEDPSLGSQSIACVANEAKPVSGGTNISRCLRGLKA